MNRYCLGNGKKRNAFITFRTTPEIKDKIRLLAKKNEEGMSEFVERILTKHLNKTA